LKTVKIPDTDIQVSSISLGTGEIGSSINKIDSYRLLDMFLEKGGTLIDTAHSYGDWVPGERSISEKTIGTWIKDRKNRDKVILSTKGCDPIFGDITHKSRFNREELLSDLNGSLELLNTDYIDFYWIHKDEPNVPVDVIIETINEQVKLGKIRCFGFSNWQVARIKEAENYAKSHGLKAPLGDQVLWNAASLVDLPFHSDNCGFMDKERFAYHKENGKAVFAYQSQAYGIFNRMFNGTINQMNPFFRSFYNENETFIRYNRMKTLMEETGFNITQVVLGYLKGQPFTTIPIVGCRNISHLTDSMTALEITLTAEQISFIETGKIS
jgi:aryl-alcohol dehydrogenase-like predicted oxidoreductase